MAHHFRVRLQGRCLILLTGFAEPAGPKGAKTRTWVTVKEQPIFAWGGLLAAKSRMGACLFWRGHRSVTMASALAVISTSPAERIEVKTSVIKPTIFACVSDSL